MRKDEVSCEGKTEISEVGSRPTSLLTGSPVSFLTSFEAYRIRYPYQARSLRGHQSPRARYRYPWPVAAGLWRVGAFGRLGHGLAGPWPCPCPGGGG